MAAAHHRIHHCPASHEFRPIAAFENVDEQLMPEHAWIANHRRHSPVGGQIRAADACHAQPHESLSGRDRRRDDIGNLYDTGPFQYNLVHD